MGNLADAIVQPRVRTVKISELHEGLARMRWIRFGGRLFYWGCEIGKPDLRLESKLTVRAARSATSSAASVSLTNFRTLQ